MPTSLLRSTTGWARARAVTVALCCAGLFAFGNDKVALTASVPECGPGILRSELTPVPPCHMSEDGQVPLSDDDRFRIALGEVVFRKLWVSAPASTTSSDGLGPLYNARACEQCHPQGGRGQPRVDHARGQPSALVLRLSVPPRTDTERLLLAQGHNVIAEPTYGLQLQPFAIQGLRSEGRLEVTYEETPVELGDGSIIHLSKPSYRVADLGYGPMREETTISPRVAPPLVGLGLLEMVPESQILEREGGSQDTGISGVASRVWSKEQGKVVLGRFGWKAETPSLRQQVAEAFAIDLGISNSLIEQPAGDCTAPQVRCRSVPDGRSAHHGGHELGDTLLDLVELFVAYRDIPAQRSADDETAPAGEQLFHAIGCAGCHRPSLVTGTSHGPIRLRGQTIWPYTDLLLHDMGGDSADGGPEGAAHGRMWRTAPLWAIGRAQTSTGRETFLHDGRARSIEEAVLWHGGEGQIARDAFARLTAAERDALVSFVKSR